MPLSRELLTQLINKDPSLTKVEIENLDVTKTELALIAGAIRENPAMTTLRFKHCKLDSDGHVEILKAIGQTNTRYGFGIR